MKKVLLLLIVLISSEIISQYKSIWDAIPENIKEKNSFKRYEWFYRPRTDENGNLPKQHIEQQRKLEEEKILQANKLMKVKGTSDLWTNIGPNAIDMSSSFISYWGNVSGRIRGLAVHPTNPDIVYVGVAAGGIWKTTDGGNTWVDKSGGLNLLTFGAIAIDPNNPNTIYAGTGESRWFFNNVTYEGDGLYKSTNGGDTWTKITSGFGSITQFSDIEVSPHNSNILLASLGSGNWNLGNLSNEGVWRSSDAGATWTKTLTVTDAFDVAFHPTDNSIAYAASGDQSSSGGFYRSTDAGINWIQSNTGLPSATSIGRIQFSLSPSSPSIIYAIIYNTSALSGGYTTAAFKSTNGGVNWAQISSGVNIAGTYDGSTVSDQGSYDLCVEVHPTNSNIVLFGNVELSRTTDGSTINFVRNPSGYFGGTRAWDSYVHVDVHIIKFAPSNGNIVYLGCDGGVYKSTNAGATWTSLNNGINTIQFYRVASHPTNASILYGGSQDNGNFSTSNKGATNWVYRTTGDGMECFIDYNDPNYIFISTQFGNLIRSTNAGGDWTSILTVSTNTAWTAPYWQHPSDYNKIFSALDRQLYRSTNRGSTWSSISTITSTGRITSVAQSSVNTSRMIAVESYYTTSPKVFSSTNEGVNWTEITSSLGFTGTNIQRVIADPSNADVFYITRASYSTGQIYKTTNFGSSWTNISGDLPQVPVNDLFIDPANTNHLYAGNDFGVYWSSNGGTNWIKLSNGMPFVPVLDFSFYSHAGTRYLRAATHGRGVYELNIDTPLPVELISFTAEAFEDKVILKWITATETNNFGFEIERKIDNGEFNKIGFIPGYGNSNSQKEYQYEDKYVNGFLSYRLKQINNDGTFSYSDIVNTELLAITDFKVYQNYPNPFNPITVLKYKLPAESFVKITILNTLGEKVLTLSEDKLNPGIHETIWDASDFSAGVYFANFQISSLDGKNNLNKALKMILSK